MSRKRLVDTGIEGNGAKISLEKLKPGERTDLLRSEFDPQIAVDSLAPIVFC
jgi:hypothetical protein